MLYTRYNNYIKQLKKFSVVIFIKRLSKAICKYINTREVIKLNITITILLFRVLKVGVNILSILVIAILTDYIKS